jgi:hypothetical protein
MTVVGGVVALLGAWVVVVALVRSADPGWGPVTTAVAIVAGLGLAAVGVVLLVQHARRISWWRRARAAVTAAGLSMPSDLRRF